MAKAQLAPTIDAIAGHTGSFVLSQNAAGAYASLKPNYPQNRSASQKAIQSAWSNMVKAWRTATTPSQRQAWKTLGHNSSAPTRCGSTSYNNAFNEFARINQRISFLKGTLRLNPPSSDTTSGPGATTVTYTPGPPQSVTLTPTTPLTPQQVALIQMQIPQHAGSVTNRKRYKTLTITTAGQPAPWEIASEMQAFFGPIRTGYSYRFRLFYANPTEGQYSTKVAGNLVIT